MVRELDGSDEEWWSYDTTSPRDKLKEWRSLASSISHRPSSMRLTFPILAPVRPPSAMASSFRPPLKTLHGLASPDRPGSRVKLFPTFFICTVLLVISAYFTLRSLWNPLPSFGRSLDLDPSLAFHVHSEDVSSQNLTEFIPDQGVLKGTTIMPKMGNATAKWVAGYGTTRVCKLYHQLSKARSFCFLELNSEGQHGRYVGL